MLWVDTLQDLNQHRDLDQKLPRHHQKPKSQVVVNAELLVHSQAILVWMSGAQKIVPVEIAQVDIANANRANVVLVKLNICFFPFHQHFYNACESNLAGL